MGGLGCNTRARTYMTRSVVKARQRPAANQTGRNPTTTTERGPAVISRTEALVRRIQWVLKSW